MTTRTVTTECECLPGQVCEPCMARGYRNGLAGYAARIHPERVTQDDIDEQERVDRADAFAGIPNARDEDNRPF